MKPLAIVGVVLILLGVVSLVYQGIPYTTHETVIDIGPVHATADRHKTFEIPQVLGVVSLVGGIGLLVVGLRKRA
jgi:hypothetical protein